MSTIRELVERKKEAEAALAAVNAEIAARHGETDDDDGAADTGETDWEAATKAELQAALDARGVAYNSDDTKSDLLDRLAE